MRIAPTETKTIKVKKMISRNVHYVDNSGTNAVAMFSLSLLKHTKPGSFAKSCLTCLKLRFWKDLMRTAATA